MKKVLILEDEVSIRSFVVINLKRAGYEAIEAGTGREALERLKENPDTGVAILDIMLPDGSGRKLLEELKRRGIENATVSQTGCVGVCRLEPIVEVYVKGQEKVTYVHMTPEKVARVVNDHIVNGRPVEEYTVGAQG